VFYRMDMKIITYNIESKPFKFYKFLPRESIGTFTPFKIWYYTNTFFKKI